MRRAWLGLIAIGVITLSCLQCVTQERYRNLSPAMVRWDDSSVFREDLVDARILDNGAAFRTAPNYHLAFDISDDLDSAACRMSVRYVSTSDAPVPSVDFLLLPNMSPGTLSVEEVRVDGVEARTEYQNDDTLLRVHFPTPVDPGGTAIVTVRYTLRQLLTHSVGFGGFGFSGGILNLGYAYPVIPDHNPWTEGKPPYWGDITANPAAFYVAAISYPAALKLAAPGQVLYGNRRSADGRTSVLIAHGPARDFAFALGRGVRTTERRFGAVRIRLFAAGATGASEIDAVKTAGAALSLFGARFGSYPYRTLTLISSRLDALGLEFPGSIILASWLLGDGSREVDGTTVKSMLEATVIHEVAHQWFYGLVGNDQIAEPWIDESLAQYCTLLFEQVNHFPVEGSDGVTHFGDRWESLRNVPIPIGQPVRSYTPRQYVPIIYGRAPLFLLTLRDRMGSATFDSFLALLVREYSWRVVTGNDVRTLAERACSCNLDELWKRWVSG
ncbi:MAG TPA: M1 family aminopeptidase [Spirochaetia bacterium]|nr:M1 family aminopeptidase [Spirochaetia bacterium]